jgi:hypothetical protein
MWDSADLNLSSQRDNQGSKMEPAFDLQSAKDVEVRGIPHLAKNERDVGAPVISGREKSQEGEPVFLALG